VDESRVGEPAEPGDRPPPDPRSWHRSPVARVALVVAVVVGLATLGLVVGQHNRDDFDGTAARVTAQAMVAGDAVDLQAFHAAWNAQQSGATPGAADALVPRVDDAELARYALVVEPLQLVVDYQVDAGGQQGCIRLVRSAGESRVVMERHPCKGAFIGGD
jgi:hypothetical protein